jgi:Zn-dependent protease with chaperone function
LQADGRYFLPGSAACVPARLELSPDGQTLLVTGDAMAVQAARDAVRATARLGNLPRKLAFPDGGCFETGDNDAIDAMLQPRDRIVHRLEKSWRAVLVSVVLAVAAIAMFAFYGAPTAANWMALHTPHRVAQVATEQTLRVLDKSVLEPTRLPRARQDAILALFRDVARQAPRGADHYRLLLRHAPGIGPNAFALPDGTIVATDQLVTFARNGAELQGIFAHETAHVDRAHGLQRIYQASLVPAVVAFITGDISQVGQLAVILPGILLQSAYSRGFETQADDDAAALLRRMGKNPAPLADILERIEAKMCGKTECLPSLLGSHPVTRERAARLRRS